MGHAHNVHDDLHTFLTIESLWENAMAKGTVDFFNETGGYGFIETDDEDEDVFFHMEDVGGPDLEEGQEVEFDIEQADKGPRATNVTRL
ncbi:cold-shock DNA-binding protein family [Haladaptatus litoreus]|uniref:Cold-shock DNA-binding protein family n=2 Tax=Haladaptatus TaxID=367188 RepID=A0A1N7B6B2_9EURY|nr:cold-shock DNA-binding protein family [Haladaptatus litoreus]